MDGTQPDKGGRTEELLREYFQASGFFAVRGVPVTHAGIDITDVDIWLYLRPSPVGRERVNVDAKYKATPKALERILWAKGLQAILGLERCIVATADKRPTVKEYGLLHNVLVLDGAFISKLANRKDAVGRGRYSEEQFLESLGTVREDKLLGNWKGRLRSARARLLTQLEFDGCNAWLEDIRYFVEQAAASGRREAASRLVYLLVAYLLIGLDFCLRTLAFEEVGVRRKALEDGFRYGSRGRRGTEDTLGMAAQLVLAYAPEARAVGSRLRNDLMSELDKMPVDILSEFFSRSDNAKELFSLARSLEATAYATTFIPPGALEAQGQAVLGVLLDFLGVDRRTFLTSSISSV
jgi:hypothetical protein